METWTVLKGTICGILVWSSEVCSHGQRRKKGSTTTEAVRYCPKETRSSLCRKQMHEASPEPPGVSRGDSGHTQLRSLTNRTRNFFPSLTSSTGAVPMFVPPDPPGFQPQQTRGKRPAGGGGARGSPAPPSLPLLGRALTTEEEKGAATEAIQGAPALRGS